MARLNAEFLKKFFTQEVPSGTINGSNVTFSIAQTPLEDDAVIVFKNGLIQQRGASDDYTLSDVTITFITAPATASSLLVYYIRKTGES